MQACGLQNLSSRGNESNLHDGVVHSDDGVVAVLPAEDEAGEVDLQVGVGRHQQVLEHGSHSTAGVVGNHHNLKISYNFAILFSSCG